MSLDPELPPTALRPLTATDLDRWLALQAHIADPYDATALRQELGLRQSRSLGFAESGHLHGALLAWFVVDELQIMQVIVAPHARRRGVGRALVKQALRRARAAGGVSATLEVRQSNSAAIALYQGLGFVVDGQRRGYYPSGEDALLMRCSLAQSA